MARRCLPDDKVAKALQSTVRAGLEAVANTWPRGCMKRKLLELAHGDCSGSPFPELILEKTRKELRAVLRGAGFGDCEAAGGDAPQHFEVRLTEGLLRACRDPDHHFCQWWAPGVWIGSDPRRLPRAPAIFDRKTK